MNNVGDVLSELNVVSVFVRIILAMVLGGILGIEREQYKRAAGFRTFIIVCVGSALATMTALYMKESGMSADAARIPAQIISGMGFLGAGTILVTRNSKVKGLTTAASLWTVACIGIAVGIGFYAGAALGTFTIMLVLCILRIIEKRLKKYSLEREIYIETTSYSLMRKIVKYSKDINIVTFDFEVNSVDTSNGKIYSIIYRAKKTRNTIEWDEYFETLMKNEEVLYLEEM